MAQAVSMRTAIRILTAVILWVIAARAGDAAAASNVITLADGDVRLIRDTTLYRAAEGVALVDRDIIETGRGAFVQIETLDGAILNLASDSRLYLNHAPTTDTPERATTVFLLSGWLKISDRRPDWELRRKFVTGQVSLRSPRGAMILLAEPGRTQLVVERGRVLVSMPGQERVTMLASDDYLGGDGSTAPTVLPMAPADFRTRIPRELRDSLPPRPIKDHGVEPSRVRPVTYADLEPWLKGPAAIRAALVSQFQLLLDDPAFREQVAGHLGQHPEWQTVLSRRAVRRAPASVGAASSGAAAIQVK
jgi:hypothetical protein